jgi:hypothetical protein
MEFKYVPRIILRSPLVTAIVGRQLKGGPDDLAVRSFFLLAISARLADNNFLRVGRPAPKRLPGRLTHLAGTRSGGPTSEVQPCHESRSFALVRAEELHHPRQPPHGLVVDRVFRRPSCESTSSPLR